MKPMNDTPPKPSARSEGGESVRRREDGRAHHRQAVAAEGLEDRG